LLEHVDPEVRLLLGTDVAGGVDAALDV